MDLRKECPKCGEVKAKLLAEVYGTKENNLIVRWRIRCPDCGYCFITQKKEIKLEE